MYILKSLKLEVLQKRPVYLLLFFVAIAIFSCTKDYSLENGNNINDPLIVGIDCRINKIVYNDSATGIPQGSVGAVINAKDTVTDISQFDSVGNTIVSFDHLVYSADTIFINPQEFFVADFANGGRIYRLHGLTNPQDPFSAQFDLDYSYDAGGYLVQKSYSLSTNPGSPYYVVNYTYSGGNLMQMTGTDVASGSLIVDAVLHYYLLAPHRYIYLFPDELAYPQYNQFLNFGNKTTNAIKDLKIRYYDIGNIIRDSTVSTFVGYAMSRDNYVLSVYMNGDDQFSIPAQSGKLSFGYKCN